MNRTRSRAVVPDQACVAAVDLARFAIEENVKPEEVGEHLGVEGEGDRIVTHYFACLDRAYRGWRWAVTVAAASRARNVTVSEVVLLPGAGALLPPPWVPWSERLRPGDLGVGDLLPTSDDDDRLAPGLHRDRRRRRPADDLRARPGPGPGALRRSAATTPPTAGTPATPARTPRSRTRPPPSARTCGFYLPLAGALRTGLRGLRQRVRARRRPGRRRRPRLRRPLRGRRGAPPAEAAAADPRRLSSTLDRDGRRRPGAASADEVRDRRLAARTRCPEAEVSRRSEVLRPIYG